jgi:hypothetical protein
MSLIKVVPRSLTEAYKKREGDFSPNLVGLQFTDGSSLFTFGNFQITSNIPSKINKNFTLGGEWSDYYSLHNLNLNNTQSNLLQKNNLNVKLNFDKNKIDRYVYFGSFIEFVKVSIEDVIQKWRGSIYLTPLVTNTPVNTVLSFSYNPSVNKSTFLVPKSVLVNDFELIIDDNQDFIDLEENDIFNLSRDYEKYVVWNGTSDHKVLEYTGSTETFPYLRLVVEGNPFPTLTGATFGQYTYHIKPNNKEVDFFFQDLDDFESLLLDRLTTPIYTISFEVPLETDGFVYFSNKKISWPVSDGYNIDIKGRDYLIYIESLLEISENFDNNKTNLISRRFVSESIREFDTAGDGTEIYGMKVDKLLKIYGRSYDEVKKYIDGISFANVVTYNKLDNTSDDLIKFISKNLGFDTLLTVTNSNLNIVEQISTTDQTVFSGYSRSLSAKELDVELWRRLVINAWWLFKSKGTRKVIEFFFKLFKIPECVVSLNEYVYLAENKIDTFKVYEELLKLYNGELPSSFSELPFDEYGFPKPLPNTESNYFQMDGFWYNGGTDITIGNNPHFGEYDFGKKYISQFECFVPEFDSLITASTVVDQFENYFDEFNEGTFTFNENGELIPFYGDTYSFIINENDKLENAISDSAGVVISGQENGPIYKIPSGDTNSLKITFTTGSDTCGGCESEVRFGDDGIVYFKNGENTPLNIQECCNTYWLPNSSDTNKCPSSQSVLISNDCIVKQMGDTVSIDEDCCKTQILGFEVFWDGRSCIAKNCFSTTNEVKRTSVTSNVNSGDLYTDIKTGSNTDTPDTPLPIVDYICYWCPPNEFVKEICSSEEYFSNFNDDELREISINLGWSVNSGVNFIVFLNNIFSSFFENYGCLITDNNNKLIKGKKCCELKGGSWIFNESSNSYFCVKSTDDCSNYTINNEHVVIDSNGNVLNEDCCDILGLNYTNGTIVVYNIDGTVNEQIIDTVGSSYVNSLGLNNYCSSCPKDIVFDGDFVKTYPSLVDLSQQCCTDYGFTYDTVINKCKRCSGTYNFIPLDNNGTTVVTNLDGSELSEFCCESTGAWYGILTGTVSERCYTCPDVYNPGYSTIDTVFGFEVLYNNNSLTQNCCQYYNNVVGNTFWNSDLNKCFLRR